jgi:signal peptidase I
MAEETVKASEVESDRYGDFSDRAVARIIDLAVLTVLGLPLWGIYYLIALYGNPSAEVLLACQFLGFPVYVAYFAIMTARSGQTLGKRAMGLQVQGKDGRPPSAAASLWRAIIDLIFMRLLMLAVGFIDYLWLYSRKDRRTLHDLAVGTTVKLVRPSPNNTGLILLAALLVMQLSPQHWLMSAGSPGLDNMSPTIRKGEWWAANRLAYRHQSPGLGDVVVFHGSGLADDRPVGRIVGIPGDELIFRNGQVVRVPAGPQGDEDAGWVSVPAGSVAVLGDNRATPEAAGYQRRTGALMPPWPQRPAKPASPIVLVNSGDIKGKVIGVTYPLWRIRVVR